MPAPTLIDYIKYERSLPLAFDDLKPMVYRPGLRFIEYEHIKKTDTLKSLLPRKTSGLVVLFDDKRNHAAARAGHYCLLFKHPRSGVHFFDGT